MLLLLFDIEDQLGNFKWYAAESNDISKADFDVFLWHELDNKPQMIINYVVLVLVLVAWLKQVVMAFVVDYIEQFLLISVGSDRVFVLVGLLEEDVVGPVFLDDVRANYRALGSLGRADAEAPHEGRVAALLPVNVAFVYFSITVMKVEKTVALLFFPEPRLHHQLCLNRRPLPTQLVVQRGPERVSGIWQVLNALIICVLSLLEGRRGRRLVQVNIPVVLL